MGNRPDVARHRPWDGLVMYSTDSYLIRAALPADESLLLRISVLDSQATIQRPALIGEVNGTPAAVVELETGRVAADPFVTTDALLAHLRVRAVMAHPFDRPARLVDRMRRTARRPRWA
jgi:hypothetical protein